MKMSKRISKKYKSNCSIELFLLLLKGKLRGLVWAWPFHWMGVTKNGNYVHFTNKKERLPHWFWFYGQIELIRKYDIRRLHFGFKFNGAGKFSWIRRRKPEPLEGFI